MNEVVRWSPFNEVQNLRDEINKIFADSFSRLPVGVHMDSNLWSPAIDVYHTPEELVLEIEMPGANQENVSIDVTKDSLRFSGEISLPEKSEEITYLRRERRAGKFNRAFALPIDINPDRVSASFKDGILKIILPKAEEVKPKSVKIQIE